MFTIESLYDRMKNETSEQLLKPVDKDGKILDIKDYKDEKERKKIKLWIGHYMEAIAESLLILKCGDKLFDKCKVYHGKIGEEKEIKNFQQYIKGNINKGSGGGVSDIFLKEETKYGKTLHCWSCKYYVNNIKSIKKHEGQDIYYVIKNKIENNEIDICDFKIYYLVKDKVEFLHKLDKATGELSKIIKNDLSKKYFVYDVKDIDYWLKTFKINYSHKNIKDIRLYNKKLLKYHVHQFIISKQLIKDYLDFNPKLFGIFCVCRSGKSYIIACIIEYLNKIKSNLTILIITPIPSETMDDLLNIFNEHIQFDEFDIQRIDNKFEEVKNNKKIHLVSKQFIQDKLDKKYEKYDFIISDEVHEGGCTVISKKIIDKLSHKNTTKILVTATFNKPKLIYGLNEKFCYYWNLNDIENMKIENYDFLERFNCIDLPKENKKEYLESLCGENITEYYNEFPKLCIFTTEFIKNEEHIQNLKRYQENKIGFDWKTLFLLNDEKKFSNPVQVKSFIRSMTGSKTNDRSNIKNSVLRRIIKHKKIDNDFIGMIWFLPYHVNNRVRDISNELKEYILSDPFLDNYEVVNCSEIKSSLKSTLNKKYEKAKREGKSGIILLSARRCALGISLNWLDLVCLFNSFMSVDMIYQMMFRSMTERKNKKYGYVIDYNPNRIIQSLYSLNINVKLDKSYLYDIIGNIIDIDPDLFYQKDRTIDIIRHFNELYNMTFKNISSYDRLKIFLQDLEFEIPDGLESIHINEGRLDIKETGLVYKKSLIGIKKSKNKKDKDLDTKEIKEKNEELKEKQDKLSEEQKYKLIVEILYYYINYLTVLNNKNINIIDMIDIIMNNDELKNSATSKIETAFNSKIPLEDLNKIIDNNSNRVQNYVNQIRNEILSIKNGDERKKGVLDFINKLLTPRDDEKRNNGEVFTPINVIEEMFDMLEQNYPDIFKNKNLKWLDPSNGIGNFIIVLYYRLFKNLKCIKNKDERSKHILENMLYTCEINSGNMEIYKQLMNNDKYKLNIYTGDFFKLNSEKEWKVKKFDIIIGNPPYQENVKNGKYGSSLPLYTKFIDKSIEISNKILMIIPSRWLSGGKNLDKFRNKMLKCKKIKQIIHFDNSNKIFKNIIIEGGINYLLIDNEYKGNCKFNNIDVNLSSYDIFPTEINCIPLIEKFNNEKYIKLSTIVKGRNFFKIETNDERLNDEQNENDIECFVSSKQSKNLIKYIELDEYKKFWKVITARANGCKKNFGNIFIGNENSVYTNSYISFKVKNEIEAKSLKSYLLCKFPNVMLGLRKPTQDIKESTCNWIPIVPFNREWDDEKVYKYFEMTKDEIKLINDYCKKYKFKINLQEPGNIKSKNKQEKKTMIIMDEIKVSINDNDEIKTSEDMDKYTVPKLKKICDDNKIKRSGCKKKQDYIDCIMSSNKKIIINV